MWLFTVSCKWIYINAYHFHTFLVVAFVHYGFFFFCWSKFDGFFFFFFLLVSFGSYSAEWVMSNRYLQHTFYYLKLNSNFFFLNVVKIWQHWIHKLRNKFLSFIRTHTHTHAQNQMCAINLLYVYMYIYWEWFFFIFVIVLLNFSFFTFIFARCLHFLCKCHGTNERTNKQKRKKKTII